MRDDTIYTNDRTWHQTEENEFYQKKGRALSRTIGHHISLNANNKYTSIGDLFKNYIAKKDGVIVIRRTADALKEALAFDNVSFNIFPNMPVNWRMESHGWEITIEVGRHND